MPGSPTSRNRRPRPANASSSPATSSASSASRPTNAPRRRLGRRLGHRAAVESRILHEDRLVKLAEPAAGLDAELLDERPSRCLVGLERLGLAPGPVEAEHQLAAQTLPQRVLASPAPPARRRARRDDRWRDRRRSAARAPPGAAPRDGRSPPGRTAHRRGRRAAARATAQVPRAASARPSRDRRCRPRRRAARSGRRRARTDRPAARSPARG